MMHLTYLLWVATLSAILAITMVNMISEHWIVYFLLSLFIITLLDQ